MSDIRKQYLKYIIIFSVIIYTIFAVLPDMLNISFMPTGGWDWLNFIAIMFMVYLAFSQVILTLEAGQKSLNQQQQLSTVPFLHIDGFSHYTDSCTNPVFRVLEKNGDVFINNGFRVPMNSSKKPDGFTPSMNLIIKNYGLSTAFNIDVSLYELTKINGITTLDDFEKTRDQNVIENFYDNITYSNCKYKEDTDILNTKWSLYTLFNLTNNERDQYCFVFDLSGVKSKSHCIIKFEFTDIYENEYYQLMYIAFDEKRVYAYPVSKLFSTDMN